MASVAENEVYLDGFTSPSIRNSRFGLRPCGIYATNKRIFLVRSSAALRQFVVLVWVAGMIASGFDVVIYVMPFLIYGGTYSFTPFQELLWLGLALLWVLIGSNWYKNFAFVTIPDLEKRKIWVVQRDQISSWKMIRKFFTMSKIQIYLKSGESHSILFSVGGTFDRAWLALSKRAPSET